MSGPVYDLVILGGGISGAGILRDAAMRGLKTLLIEKGKPAHGTTINSSWLIHGGLRYLYYDRYTTHLTSWDSGHIVRIARPLLHRLPVVWPVYEEHTHGIENVEALMESYDRFQAMKLGRRHLRLSAEQVLAIFPTIREQGLVGGLAFDEYWVDPSALVGENLESGRRYGGEALTDTEVVELHREGGTLRAVTVKDAAGTRRIEGRVFVNATGPWVDETAKKAGLRVPLRLRRGTHLLYKKRLFKAGLLLEAAESKRYVFVLPMGERHTLIGPTDVPCPEPPDAIKPEAAEVDYLLRSMTRYFADFDPAYDALTVGARPILGAENIDESLLSREYEVFDHADEGVEGFVTLGGGKMSSFRIMAEDVVDIACRKLGKEARCRTHEETLAGGKVPEIPVIDFPGPAARAFMQRHPYVRKAHAMGHLAFQAAKHWAGKLAAPDPQPDFFEHFKD